MEKIATRYTNEAKENLKKLAKNGDDEAMLELGLRFKGGHGLLHIVNAAMLGNVSSVKYLVEQANLRFLSDKVRAKVQNADPKGFANCCISIYPFVEGTDAKTRIKFDHRIAQITHWLFNNNYACHEYATDIIGNRPFIAARLFLLCQSYESFLYCLVNGIGVKKNAKLIAEYHHKLGSRSKYVALASENNQGIEFSVKKTKAIRRHLWMRRIDHTKDVLLGCFLAPFKAYFSIFDRFLKRQSEEMQNESQRAIEAASNPYEWVDAVDAQKGDLYGEACLGCIVYGFAILIPIIVIYVVIKLIF